jgi:hypothetical protein
MLPIYQLLQWLVKKLLESRDERNSMNKQIAMDYYNVNLGEANDKTPESTNTASDMHTHTKYNYINTGRLFRRAQSSDLEYNDPLRVYFTLVEYGMNKDLSFQRTMIDLLKKKNMIDSSDIKDSGISSQPHGGLPNIKDNQGPSTITITNDEKNKLDEVLLSNIKEVHGGLNKLNTGVIEELFSENVDSIIKEIEK